MSHSGPRVATVQTKYPPIGPRNSNRSPVRSFDEIGRNLAVLHPLHGQSQQFVFRRRTDRIAALCLVAIFGGKTDIEMLARQVALPIGYVQQKTFYPVRFDDDFTNVSPLPLEPPRGPGCRLNHRHISALSRGRRNCGNPTTPRSRVYPVP